MTLRTTKRPRYAVLVATAATAALATGVLVAPSATAASGPGSDIGFQAQAIDQVQGSSVPTSATAPKTEHKVWFAGGSWWASMKNPSGTGFTIHQLVDRDATPSWTDTGVSLDDRNGTSADAIYNATANKLFVASHVVAATNSATTAAPVVISRYTLTSGVWTQDATPVTVFSQSLPSFAIAQESDGQLLATFTYKTRVYALASVGSANAAALSFTKPFLVQWNGPGHNLLAVDQTLSTTVTSDDVSAITSGGSYTTIVWSNQNRVNGAEGFYAARHTVSGAYGVGDFYGSRLITGVPWAADNHISLTTDPSSGKVYAAVKTSNNDPSKPTITGTDPLLELFKLTPHNGSSAPGPNAGYIDATSTTLTTVDDGGTRPVVALDNSRHELDVFFSAPENGPIVGSAETTAGVIFRKTVALSDMSVTPSSGRGTEVLYHLGSDGTTAHRMDGLNDASVSAGPFTSATGVVVLATSSVVTNPLIGGVHVLVTARSYWFNDLLRLPVASFTSSLHAGDTTALQADFHGASTAHPTSWAWDFGDLTSGSNTSSIQNPSHTFATPGAHTVTLTTTNEWGTSNTFSATVVAGQVPTPAWTIARISPSVIGLRFTDRSAGLPSSVTWSFGDGTASVTTGAGATVSHVYKVAKAYTVTLTSTNPLGHQSKSVLYTTSTINAAPAAPGRPTAKAYTKLRVLVSWHSTVPNGLVITKYLVRCYSTHLPTRSLLVKGTVRAAYVAGLVAGHKYICTVTAYNARGYGKASPVSAAIVAKK